ncbi:phosphoribosylformylglycinamidine synthase subunit PurS [Leucobacter musarum]|uniref:phosphoribosylformylglycinamidine synthase subunit PurS n=1 Tax=Leucobacter musarum TaxID=1930747 RepID=UPI0006A772F9|nr:phosphoribosylformylglycinamidine synthase subunit PurS [Leucobacter musarum]
MPTIVVDVMPKAELLDPQGKATTGALARLGHEKFENVRIGKRFEFQVAEATAEVLDEVRQVAADILSNDVIEDVVAISVDGAPVDVVVGEAR